MAEYGTVLTHLNRLRRSHRARRLALVGLASGVGLLGTWFVFVASDLLLRFPQAVCWLFFGLLLALVAGAGYVASVLLRQRLSEAAIAVLAERACPGAENCLVNAVQLRQRVPHAELFVDQILLQADPPLAEVRGRDLSSPRPYRILSRTAAGLAVACVILFLISPRGVARSTLRLFTPMSGVEPYTLTKIAGVSPGDTSVLRGQDLSVTVDFAGAVPRRPRVVWHRGDSPPLTVSLVPLEGHEPERPGMRRYTAALEGVFHESEYRVLGGDAKSPWFAVAVTSPPGLLEWEAHVEPPRYLKRKAFRLDKTSEELEVPAGSAVRLSGVASCPLRTVAARQDGGVLAQEDTKGRERFDVTFNIGNGGRLRVFLLAENGLQAEETLPFVVLLDQAPRVVLMDQRLLVMAEPDSLVPVAFRADDDYGIGRVGLEQLLPEGRMRGIQTEKLQPVKATHVGRFILDLAKLSVKEGDDLRVRVWAEDNAPGEMRHRAFSPVLTVRLPQREEVARAEDRAAEERTNLVLELIRRQRDNLRLTRNLADMAVGGQQFEVTQLRRAQAAQTEIRELGGKLLQDPESIGDLRNTLAGLVEHEMADVIALFDRAHREDGQELGAVLRECVRLETQILAVLTGMPTLLAEEEKHQEKVDLLARLQRLVERQAANLKATKEAAKKKEAPSADLRRLARVEDQLANDLVAFTDQCWVIIDGQDDAELGARVRDVYDLFGDRNVYESMLSAAEALEYADLPTAVQTEATVLSVLLEGLDILNRWRVKNARERLEKAVELISDLADQLSDMEATQAEIAEVTRDLTKRGILDDSVREQLGKMDREQDEMGKLVEKLAQDLYQFPELPVCNELNSKMQEIFEDVEQASDSENTPSLEIAVQKEDSLLDAIRNTKERVEDIEMWLPDVPDNIVWNMESFDTDEFPDIPLVPLPDELEDIVGELLDQASEIEAQSQDTTGNNLMADGEMGWGIMDGPMPNFSAKGKSGNMKPNDNEMTGRSGAGREGQASGELVENHVKGLEGRDTHARRTRDPFQKGQVTEDENSTLDAKSTGGGKLGGESETVGMFANAPRRDTHVPDHGAPTSLRQETEALYAAARLLYLGTGTLGAASREMRGLEAKTRDMKGFESLHRKVLRRLRESQVEIANDVVLPMPVSTVSKTGGAAVQDVDISQISDDYRDIVSDYYKGLEAD